MFKNYIQVALRNMIRHKLYAILNITGLSIGIACCILIFLFVRNELSYDEFHKNASNIYRVYVTEAPPDRDAFTYAETPAPMASAMEQSFPDVERAVRILARNDIIRYQDQSFSERYHLADTDFFEVFTFPLIRGNPGDVLTTPNSVVLTESMASKVLGEGDHLGKTISIKLASSFHDFVVTGIAQDVPENSSIKFNLVIPFDNVRQYVSERTMNAWFNVFMETYVLLPTKPVRTEMAEKLKSVVATHYPEGTADIVTLHLQPITDIHLNPDVPAGLESVSDPVYSTILVGIGILVLAIACINFMLLAIGRSSGRAKEVGVRKVMGAVKNQLIRQFWGEAIIMSLLALCVGILLAEIFLPYFNVIAQKQLDLSYDWQTLTALLTLMILVGIAAGSYPSFILAGFQIAEIIKGGARIGRRRLFGRSLVVIQFALSIFLMISTLIMAKQLNFLKDQSLGYNKKQVVVIKNNSPQGQDKLLIERFRNEVAGRKTVTGVAGASTAFSKPWAWMGFRSEDGTYREFHEVTVDYDYLSTMEIDLVEGRNFSRDMSTDSTEAIIVNQALIDYFGWDSPFEKQLPGSGFPPHKIIGITKNFNFESLQNKVAPLVLTLNPQILYQGINDISSSISPSTLNFVHVRIEPGNIPATIEFLKQSWEKIAGNQPFNFSFLDEDVDRQYREQERWSGIVGNASRFALLIACLGLFGLAALAVARRTKEIGIRKVLGASSSGIVFMLSGDFGKLVLLANLIAWPFSYWVMRNWLQNFAYRTNLGLDSFIIAGAATLAAALVAVTYQSIKASLENPVNTIRYE